MESNMAQQPSSDLPMDLILDILTRFPTKFIGKSRILSKTFNQLTHLSFFKNLQANRSAAEWGFLLQSLAHNKHVFSLVSAANINSHIDFCLNFLPGWDPKILAVASHGLVLSETKNPHRHNVPNYHICKPMIKQWRQIPNPKTRYFTVHTAMAVLGSNPLRFKIVRISKPKPSDERRLAFSRLVCEIFDSQTWRWKQTEDIKLLVGTFFLSHTVVSASGAAHWQLSDDTVFRFRFDSEGWSRFPLPDDGHENHKKLAEYEGKLALMCMEDSGNCCSSTMEVWILTEQYEKKIVWNKKEIRINNEEVGVSPMAFHSSDIAVMWGNQKLIYSKFTQESCCMSGLQSHYQPQIFPFWSDYEECNFTEPIKISKTKRKKMMKKKLEDAQGDEERHAE